MNMALLATRELHHVSEHKPSDSSSTPYSCQLCSKTFTRKENLQGHLRSHAGERPFACGVCGKAFTRKHDCTTHEKLHGQERKYICRGQSEDGQWGCGKRFARATNLQRHLQSEIGKQCISARPSSQSIMARDAANETNAGGETTVAPSTVSNRSTILDNNSLQSSVEAQVEERANCQTGSKYDWPEPSNSFMISSTMLNPEHKIVTREITDVSLGNPFLYTFPDHKLSLGCPLMQSHSIHACKITEEFSIEAEPTGCTIADLVCQPTFLQSGILAIPCETKSSLEVSPVDHSRNIDAPLSQYRGGTKNSINITNMHPIYGNPRLPIIKLESCVPQWNVLKCIISVVPQIRLLPERNDETALTTAIQVGLLLKCSGSQELALVFFKALYQYLADIYAPENTLRLGTLMSCLALGSHDSNFNFTLTETTRLIEWLRRNEDCTWGDELTTDFTKIRLLLNAYKNKETYEGISQKLEHAIFDLMGHLREDRTSLSDLSYPIRTSYLPITAATKRLRLQSCSRAALFFPELFLKISAFIADGSNSIGFLEYNLSQLSHIRNWKAITDVALFLFSQSTFSIGPLTRLSLPWDSTQCECLLCAIRAPPDDIFVLEDFNVAMALGAMIHDEMFRQKLLKSHNAPKISVKQALETMTLQNSRTKREELVKRFMLTYDNYARELRDMCSSYKVDENVVQAVLDGVQSQVAQRESQKTTNISTVSKPAVSGGNAAAPELGISCEDAASKPKRLRSRDVSTVGSDNSHTGSHQQFKLLTKKIKKSSDISYKSTVSAFSNMSISTSNSLNSKSFVHIFGNELKAGKLLDHGPTRSEPEDCSKNIDDLSQPVQITKEALEMVMSDYSSEEEDGKVVATI